MTEGKSIRERCASLRKLLGSVKPVDMGAILQEVAQIERDATKAGRDRLTAVGNELRLLMVQLSYRGIITAESWKEFFGEAELPCSPSARPSVWHLSMPALKRWLTGSR